MADTKIIKKLRILIVDDHPAVRESLAFWISQQPDLEVCGEAADMGEALRSIEKNPPDLAIVDISLKVGNGIDLIKRIMSRTDAVRILVWSSHSEELYAERVLRAGALGYVSKEQAMCHMMEAIRSVLSGKVYLSDIMIEKLLKRTVGEGGIEKSRSPLDALADRELEVFRFIGEGIKTLSIAERMHLSVHTVETYRERIKQKLALKDGAELSHFATRWVLANS